MYKDLNAPQSSGWSLLLDSGTGLGSKGLSLGQKRSKRTDANEKNPGYPSKGLHRVCKISSHEILYVQIHEYVRAHLSRQRHVWVCGALQRSVP
jgi:hypothetical protein